MTGVNLRDRIWIPVWQHLDSGAFVVGLRNCRSAAVQHATIGSRKPQPRVKIIAKFVVREARACWMTPMKSCAMTPSTAYVKPQSQAVQVYLMRSASSYVKKK